MVPDSNSQHKHLSWDDFAALKPYSELENALEEFDLPEKTYRQISELRKTLCEKAQEIERRELQLSTLIAQFEKEKISTELKRHSFLKQQRVENRLDELITGESRPSSAEKDFLNSLMQTPVDANDVQMKPGDQSGQTADESHTESKPEPVEELESILAEVKSIDDRLQQTAAIHLKTPNQVDPQPETSIPEEDESSDNELKLQPLPEELANSSPTDTQLQNQPDVLDASDVSRNRQLTSSDFEELQEINEESGTESPAILSLDAAKQLERVHSAVQKVRQRSEIISAVFVELDLIVQELGRQQQLLGQIKIDQRSKLADEFHSVSNRLTRRFRRITENISLKDAV